MNGYGRAVGLTVLIFVATLAPSLCAFADWQENGNPVSGAVTSQTDPHIISDGAGGAIITWTYGGTGNYDIYAQRVDSLGAVKWTANGVPICTAANNQSSQQLVSDGAGGAIITWLDTRGGSYSEIYAQHVDSLGAVKWTANGVPICTGAYNKYSALLVSDGAGGAIITWVDTRSVYSDIYAQRVDASGAVRWTANGVPICTGSPPKGSGQLVSDGAGGAIITWQDYRGVSWDIYAQRVGSSGVVQWATNGVAICAAVGNQQSPQPVSDGAGGAIVTWQDYRSDANTDIYAQRVDASGAVKWTANGVAICTAPYVQSSQQLVSDGAGGAIITWGDSRSDTNTDIYAQRVDASGAVKWATSGVPICTAANNQSSQQLVSDGAGGAIITWGAAIGTSDYDIYAQRVDASGAVKWTANGVPICTAANAQYYPQLVSHGVSGAIVTWQDYRSGTYHIYAQRVDERGYCKNPLPSIAFVRDVPDDQGGYVAVAWNGSSRDVQGTTIIAYYSIWRALPQEVVMSLVESIQPVRVSVFTEDLRGSSIRVTSDGVAEQYWELIGKVDAHGLKSYSFTAHTLFDSTSVCNAYHSFFVSAHTADFSVYWDSAPDSGYSVDNLSPDPPTGLAGDYNYPPGELLITWDESTEADLSHYAVYKGNSESFVPSPSNRIGAPEDTTFVDSSFDPNVSNYYKISAWDIHENESRYSLLRPEEITGAGAVPAVPAITALEQNVPNPFNPLTLIRFAVASPGWVELRVYDVVGRPVRKLAEGTRAVGRYEVTWDGRDDDGVSVASGVYMYELRAPGRVESKKMVLLK